MPGAAPGNLTAFKLRSISQSEKRGREGSRGAGRLHEEAKTIKESPDRPSGQNNEGCSLSFPNTKLSAITSCLDPRRPVGPPSQADLNKVGEGERGNKPPSKPDLSHTRCHGGCCRDAGQHLARCSLRQGTAPAGHVDMRSPLTFTSFPFISGSSPIFLLSSIRIS